MRIYKIPQKRNNFINNLLGNNSATKLLIFANIIVFIIATILNFLIEGFTFNYLALNPSFIFHGKFLWTFLTSIFMHGGILHIFVNMFVLFSLGGMMERIVGKKRFLIFYLVSGLLAGLLFVLLAYFFGNTELGARIFGSPDIPAVGASGAIFAIAGLFMVLTPNIKFMIIFLPFFSLPAYVMIPLVLFGTWLVSSSAGFPVGNTAHFGGFLCGILYGLYLRKKYPNKTQMLSKHFSN